MTTTTGTGAGTGRNRRLQQGDRSREEILDAASALMSAKGYTGTSISDLARMSGLPASSIYWHFESKAGVLAAVMERGAGRFFTAVAATTVPGGPDPRLNLLGLMRHGDAAVREHPEFLRLFMLLLLGSEGGPEQMAVVAKVRQEACDRLRTALLMSYAPWGDGIATRIADELGAVLLALFDGVFIAGQADSIRIQDTLVTQMVDAVHALALSLRLRV